MHMHTTHMHTPDWLSPAARTKTCLSTLLRCSPSRRRRLEVSVRLHVELVHILDLCGMKVVRQRQRQQMGRCVLGTDGSYSTTSNRSAPVMVNRARQLLPPRFVPHA